MPQRVRARLRGVEKWPVSPYSVRNGNCFSVGSTSLHDKKMGAESCTIQTVHVPLSLLSFFLSRAFRGARDKDRKVGKIEYIVM
jgi:hypothetical protein